MTDAGTAKYDFFLVYATADRPWVQGFLAAALVQAGLCYTTPEKFALGVPRLAEYERAIHASRRILLILTPAYLATGVNTFTDVLAQTLGVETTTWPVIPVLLYPVALPSRLAMLTRIDACDPSDWPAVVAQLCALASRPVPGPPPVSPCPYPGMRPFTQRDAAYFYGRDAEIEDLLGRLRYQRFLWVIGPSGSGKSSLIFAGLLPRLEAGGPAPAASWLVRVLRPGSQPLQSLAGAIQTRDGGPALGITDLLAAHPPAARLLLIVDQFEELFTLADRRQRATFVQALHNLHADTRCVLLLTMRADFYPDLMNSTLWPIEASWRLELSALPVTALRQAIQAPAAVVGVYLEAGLVERLVADAADEPGVLPLLQETMVCLWPALQQRYLPLIAYEKLGREGRSGLAVAVATKADAGLTALSVAQQALVRRIFLRLVQFGEGRPDTRRQQRLADLHTQGDDPVAFAQTLGCLADHRLLTVSGAASFGAARVDMAHEVLIAGWPRFQRWIQERREAEQTRRRLEAKAQEWTRLGKGAGGSGRHPARP